MLKNALSIRKKIFIFGILAVAPPMLVGNFLFASYLEKESIQSAHKEGSLLTSVISFNVLQWEEKLGNLTESLAQAKDLRSGSKVAIEKYLRKMNTIYRETYLIFVTDERGKMIARSDQGILLDQADRQYIRRSLLGKKSHQTLISKTFKKPAVCFSSPIIEGPKIKGTLSACAFVDEFSKSLNSVMENRIGSLLVTDSEGYIVARSGGSLITTLQKLEMPTGPEDANYIYSQVSNATGWKILMMTDKKEVLRTAKSLKVLGGLSAILLALVVEAVFFISAFYILKPLPVFIDAFKAIKKGKFSQRLEVRRKDEFGIMAETFNSMAEQIEALFDENSDYRGRLLETNMRLENDIIEKTQQLVASSKMSALGEMTGGIAHEINTPLATIKILVGQTLQEAQGDIPEIEPMIENLKKIDITTDRVAKIIKGLKTFARSGENDPMESFSLQSVIEDTLVLCQDRFRLEAVNLIYAPLEKDIIIEGRPVELGQVILNLLTNSMDAISSQEEKWVKIDAEVQNENVLIKITDCGDGIPEEFRDKIFQPFFTTKGVGKGTGLGLSLSHGIVQSHGGELYVDGSCPHTCFVLRIPQNQNVNSQDRSVA